MYTSRNQSHRLWGRSLNFPSLLSRPWRMKAWRSTSVTMRPANLTCLQATGITANLPAWARERSWEWNQPWTAQNRNSWLLQTGSRETVKNHASDNTKVHPVNRTFVSTNTIAPHVYVYTWVQGDMLWLAFVSITCTILFPQENTDLAQSFSFLHTHCYSASYSLFWVLNLNTLHKIEIISILVNSPCFNFI